MEVFVEGLAEPVSCTAGHPFWSEDRRAFVQAGWLVNGERLRTRAAGLARVAAVRRRPGAERVYNLEVWDEHVYEVSRLGILVHNICKPTDRASVGKTPEANRLIQVALDDIQQGRAASNGTFQNRPPRGQTKPSLPNEIDPDAGITKMPRYEYYDVPSPQGSGRGNRRLVHDVENDLMYYSDNFHDVGIFSWILDWKI